MGQVKRFRVLTATVLLVLLGFVQTTMAQSELAAKVDELADKLTSSISGEVASVEGEIIYVNLGEKDSVSEGSQFEVVRLGEVIMVGNKPVHKERPIGEIQITKVRKDMSLAKNTTSYAQIEKGDRVYQKRKRVTRIALTEFPYGESLNNLTKYVYESLSVSFSQKGMQVVERSQLEKVLQEQKISYSGMIDIGTAQKLGQLLGTEAVLLGTATDMGNSIAIRARWVDAGKGVVITAAQVEVTKNPEIVAMLGRDNRGPGNVNDSAAISDNVLEVRQSAAKCSPAKTERFVVSLSRATADSNRNITMAKLSIQNTTSEPLFLALNKTVRPVLTDDETGLSAYHTDSHGISSIQPSGNEMEMKDEGKYSRISPGQSLDVGLAFTLFPTGYKPGSQVRVTIDFISLHKGKVERMSASPCNQSAKKN